jgi:hypothetical protein
MVIKDFLGVGVYTEVLCDKLCLVTIRLLRLIEDFLGTLSPAICYASGGAGGYNSLFIYFFARATLLLRLGSSGWLNIDPVHQKICVDPSLLFLDYTIMISHIPIKGRHMMIFPVCVT